MNASRPSALPVQADAVFQAQFEDLVGVGHDTEERLALDRTTGADHENAKKKFLQMQKFRQNAKTSSKNREILAKSLEIFIQFKPQSEDNYF